MGALHISAHMRAARFQGKEDGVVIADVERPRPSVDEVLVEIKAAGLCGSDVHYLDPDSDSAPDTVPLTIGHEGAGEVVEIGEEVDSVAVGDRVIIHYVDSCGSCKWCMRGRENRCRHRESIGAAVDGTFAEAITVHERSVVTMPDSIPYEWGSLMGCAGATGFHAVERSNLSVGDTVAVFGAGGVGSQAILWAAFRGAREVIAIEPVGARRDLAAELGATKLVDPADGAARAVIDEVTDGYGVDVSLECSGRPDAMAAAIDAINGSNKYESGTAVSVGLQEAPLEAEYWGLREGQLMVSGDHTRDELRTIVELLAADRVDPSPAIGERFALSELSAAVERLHTGDSVGRLIIDPTLA